MPRRNRLPKLLEGWCLGAGFVALDVVRSINGHTTERRYAGGSCGNVIAILSFLGWKSAPIARIGSDLSGLDLVNDLEHFSVDTRFLARESDRHTPVVFQDITFDRCGVANHRFSRICPSCGYKTVGYRPLFKKEIGEILEEIPTTSVFYFDRVARPNLEIALHAKAGGALIVFEPSGVKDIDLFTECLRACHVFKYSHERISGVQDLVVEAEVPVEIKTLGSSGLRMTVRCGHITVHEEELPAFPAPRLRDAAGSGDWCSAGLIHALLVDRHRVPDLAKSQKALVRALRWGQALAALNCAFESARGLMYAMSREAVLEAVADIMKGKSVSVHLETNAAVNRRSRERSDICIVCDRKLSR